MEKRTATATERVIDFLGKGGFGVPVADFLVRSLHPRLRAPGAYGLRPFADRKD